MFTPGVDSPDSEAPDHPDLTVTRTHGVTKARKMYTISGISPGNEYRAYNNTISCMERAVKERLFYIKTDEGWSLPPSPLSGFVEEELSGFSTAFAKLSNVSHPLGRADFVALFNGRKLLRYTRAMEELELAGLALRDAYLKYFIKLETYCFSTKTNPAPRGINPRSDKYLVEMGRYIRALEKRIYKDLCAYFGYEVVMKGKNQSERGSLLKEYWDSFEDPVCVMGDASRFEQSVSVDMLEFEHRVYQKYFPGDKLFKKLCRWQLHSRGKARCADGYLSFLLSGIRASGDPNTALGNCLISAAMADAYLRRKGISKHRVFLDGDDIGFIMERSDYKAFSEGNKAWYLSMGFRMKFEKVVDIFEHIDFCKSRPVWTPEGYLMARNPISGHSKDSVCKINLETESLAKSWFAAVGMGGVATLGGIPISQAYYMAMGRAGVGAKPMEVWSEWHRENKYRGMNREVGVIHPRTRHSYWLAYGITPDAQIAIEQEFDQLDLDPKPREGDVETLQHLCWGS